MSVPFSQKPYPFGSMHNCIRDAFYEVRGNLQAPDALIGGSFLTAMSITAQRDVDVLLPTGQRSPVSLDVLTIADSGERKTATDSIVLAPIYDHDIEESRKYQGGQATYKANVRIWKAVNSSIERMIVKAVNSGDGIEHLRCRMIEHGAKEPCEPERHRIIYQSVTERPLMEALRGDGRSVAIVSDEGELVLKGGALNRLSPLTKAWDGPKLLTFDRADIGIEVRNPRVTLSLMLQEKIFADFMAKRGDMARASGFLARFLVGWPASTQGFRWMSLAEPVWEHLRVFHQRMIELLDAADQRRNAGDTSRSVLSFSPEAKELWVKMQNDIEPNLKQGWPLAGVRDSASKFMAISGRVAAIFHHFTGQDGNVVGMETLQRAIDIVGWYGDEFIRLFGDRHAEPESQRDKRRMFAYLLDNYWRAGVDRALRNEVRRNGPIRHQGRFEVTLQGMCWDGAMTVEHEQKEKGKGRLWIRLNPTVFGPIV